MGSSNWGSAGVSSLEKFSLSGKIFRTFSVYENIFYNEKESNYGILSPCKHVSMVQSIIIRNDIKQNKYLQAHLPMLHKSQKKKAT